MLLRKRNSLLNADSVSKNYVFQFIYQAIILIVPLVVSPYLTRTLGSTELGVYTYTYSIAYYFVIVAMLGINKHGQRIIAQRRKDIVELRKTFWSLYFVHVIASFFCIIAYVFYVVFICNSDANIAFIQTIYVFSAALDITWLFMGLEKFRIVSIRNSIVKLVETALIFCLVKSPADIGIYTLIMCASVCVGQLVMMPQVLSEIPPIRFDFDHVKEHIKPLFTLFAATVAVTLYTVFDKTLLGIMSTKDNVAFYEYSNKIVSLPRTFIAIIGTVLYPRACAYAEEGKYEALKKNMKYSMSITCLIGFGSAFGLAAIAELFAIEYYGVSFAVCGSIIISMCPLVLIIGLGETVRSLYIYPFKKDGIMVGILTANACINLILSILLIPTLGVYGAVIGTTCAELFGLIAEFFICRQYQPLKTFCRHGLPLAICGFLMFICVKAVSLFINDSILALLIQVLVGVVVYCILVLIYAHFFDNILKELINTILSTIKRGIKKIVR